MYTYERSCSYPDGHRNVVFAQRGVRPLPRLINGRGKILDNLPVDAEELRRPDVGDGAEVEILLVHRLAADPVGQGRSTDVRGPRDDPGTPSAGGCR